MGIKIIQSGLLTTVQDLGRFHYQQFGVSPGGAMDSRSFRLANLLVCNDYNEAELEVTMIGPKLQFTSDTVIAVTGGNLTPCINDSPIELYRAVSVSKGDILSFQKLKTGCRSYLAFAGGLDIEPIMGSRSTLLRGEIGGYQGRKLQSGDEINFRAVSGTGSNLDRRWTEPEDFSSSSVTLRVLMGPQDDMFTQQGIRTLLQTPYTVSPNYDRMGYRLEGKPIEHVRDANIISDGIALGSIQVPGNGKPIIMMAERPSSGGYTKIANVITVDLPKLAQCKEGDRISFRQVGIEEAHALYHQEFQFYQQLERQFSQKVLQIDQNTSTYQVTVNGKRYFVTIQRR